MVSFFLAQGPIRKKSTQGDEHPLATRTNRKEHDEKRRFSRANIGGPHERLDFKYMADVVGQPEAAIMRDPD